MTSKHREEFISRCKLLGLSVVNNKPYHEHLDVFFDDNIVLKIRGSNLNCVLKCGSLEWKICTFVEAIDSSLAFLNAAFPSPASSTPA